MSANEPKAPVPGQEAAPAPTGQTPPSSAPPAGTTPPESLPQTPPPEYLTREQAAEIFQQQLSLYGPDLANRIQQQLAQTFAPRTEVKQAAQSAADKTYAKYMKEMARIAPALQGFDEAVAANLMDPVQAEQAKARMMAKATAKLAEDEPEPPTAQAPQQPAPPAPPPQVPNTAREMQLAAERLLNKSGMSWNDVRAEMDAFKRSQGRDPGLDEFTQMVASKVVDKQVAGKRDAWMKEYEAKTGSVKAADAAGATAPPPSGAPAGHIPKATLDDAGDIADALAERFGLGKAS